MPDDLLLPEGARLVHIGPQKTGTTSIQVAMAEARDAMGAHGAYYPSGDHRRRRAGWALGLPGAPRDTPIEHWEELVAEVRAAGPVRVCVSDENFARAEPAVVERIVRDLGGDRVHVVATARRLDRFLPSQWQERVKARIGTGAGFEEWLTEVLDDRPGYSWERWNVWMGHDVAGLVRRWVDVVGEDRFTLVVADEADRSQLTTLFEKMLGLPSGTLQLHPDRSNEGFGLAEVELLRRLKHILEQNEQSSDQLRTVVRSAVRRYIASRPDRAPGPRHAPIPAWAMARIRELSDRRADAVSALGVRVVGDPESLRVPADLPADEVDLGDLTVPLELAAGAIVAAVEREKRMPAVTAARRLSGDQVASDLSGRELLAMAVRRARARLRRS